MELAPLPFDVGLGARRTTWKESSVPYWKEVLTRRKSWCGGKLVQAGEMSERAKVRILQTLLSGVSFAAQSRVVALKHLPIKNISHLL